MTRPSGRANDALRNVTLEPGFSLHAEGSCLALATHMFCVRHQLMNVCPIPSQFWQGMDYRRIWNAACSTHTRTDREAARGKQGGPQP